ncbi:Outer kinetochore ask1 [Hyphodiscus hymeniophilus]|uniref:DASH complex subunit ASK1 n=1 Tax=Hyphodiscus hymeniophilus TaxID=353542 RepID=A0A9P6VJF3_9HELO|nr:Outer kinetochore ask1 [Hyphodiscus hymeniophilus]
MNRSTAPSARPLSLTEELEKLEQSITLTLQEIDHNFSRAHRIVTSSILPIVERYAEHSTAVWEGSKFWKQFFEASANVSLSGVEERDDEEEDFSYTQSHENASTYATSTSQRGDGTLMDGEEHETYDQADDSLLDNADISGSTPRVPGPKSTTNGKPNFADYPSPYEALKQELKVDAGVEDGDDTQIPPATPGAQSRLPDMSMTPKSSPFDPTAYLASTVLQPKPGENQLLHRVLDKNYRLQATPHTTRKENKTPADKTSWRDTTSPMSSPPVAAPKLHADIFSSPIRQQYNRPSAPRTPGLSVQTPAKKKAEDIPISEKDEITWESDSDEDAEGVYREMGMSPPKTIQFSLPQSRLMQTPARQASKRIVEDLLATAGVGFDDSDGSPSVVAVKDDLDYSF